MAGSWEVLNSCPECNGKACIIYTPDDAEPPFYGTDILSYRITDNPDDCYCQDAPNDGCDCYCNCTSVADIYIQVSPCKLATHALIRLNKVTPSHKEFIYRIF